MITEIYFLSCVESDWQPMVNNSCRFHVIRGRSNIQKASLCRRAVWTRFLIFGVAEMSMKKTQSCMPKGKKYVCAPLLHRSLMVGWRTKCFHFAVCVFICLCVCAQATEHTFWPRNLIIGMRDAWDMRKCFFNVPLYNSSNTFGFKLPITVFT